MRALKFIPQYTIEDYKLWEGDWELIDGLAYAMSPSPIYEHQRLGALLLRQIGESIDKHKDVCDQCREVYELDWIINENTVVRPDIAVICNKSEKYILYPPVVIIEILSPATGDKDRHVKFEIYQEQMVKYYLVVDPTGKSYHIFQLINGTYREQQDITVFDIHDHCKIDINIAKALANI